MPLIHRLSEIELKKNKSPIPHFSWKSSLPLEEGSKVSYYSGEEGVRNKWPEELLKKE